MMVNALDGVYEGLVDAVSRRAEVSGFRRQGRTLRARGGNNWAILEFQRSTKTTGTCIVFTVNLAVVCGDLATRGAPDKPRAIDGHIQTRIGSFLPGHPDKWWEISAETSLEKLESELCAVIEGRVIPYLMRYLQTEEIMNLWIKGESPGLTRLQRAKYLEKLMELRDKK